MKVRVTGGSPREPEIVPIKRGRSIRQEVENRLDTLDQKHALLIHAPPGMGKTHTVGHVLIPWAKSKGLDVAVICTRLANADQSKRNFVKAIGEGERLQELTDMGLHRETEFGNVTIMTYHKLASLMQNHPASLRRYGALMFDEIHGLLDDALFSSCSGYVLEHLLEHFGGAIRIYLSATPQAILPELARIEAPYTIQVLRFPPDYSYVRPRFFQDKGEIVRRINEDKGSGKWLVFLPSIAAGQQLKDQLKCSARLLNAQEREKDQDGWNTIMKDERFEEKVCICTAVVDVGVNLKDPLLRNVVVFSTNPNTLIQFLGRKRRSANEQVNLYVWCPAQQDLAQALHQNKTLMEAVELYRRDYPRFLRQHILPSQEQDLRGWVRATNDGKLELNPLVLKHLQVQKSHLEKLFQRAVENKGDCRFDRFVANLLRIPLPDRSECWLDPKYSGTAKAEFKQFLSNSVDKTMGEDEFLHFCEQFKNLCVASYGTNGGKDRADRPWRAQKIANKLMELDSEYELRIDSTAKTVTLEPTVNAVNAK